VRVVVIDFSTSKKFNKIASQTLSLNLFRVSKRIFLGSVPNRVLQQISKELKSKASTATLIVIFVADKRSPNGWEIIKIGNPLKNDVLSNFDPMIEFKCIKTNKKIDFIVSKIDRNNGSQF